MPNSGLKKQKLNSG